MESNSQPCPHIRYAIANKDSIAQIKLQLIASAQQHPRSWFSTGTMFIFVMRAIIHLLYLAPILSNSSQHQAMNILHRLYWDSSLGYTCLVRANHYTMTG